MRHWLFSFFVLLYGLSSFGQSKLSADLCYLQGFQSHDLQIWKTTIENYKAPGWAGHLFYSYSFEKPAIDLRLGFGVQQFFLSGNAGNESFTGDTWRVDLILQGLYNFNDKWAAGFGFNLENNHDFEDFRIKATDNFRYNFLFDIRYNLNEKVGFFLRYYHILYPNVDVYLLSNPAQKAGFGINYNILPL